MHCCLSFNTPHDVLQSLTQPFNPITRAWPLSHTYTHTHTHTHAFLACHPLVTNPPGHHLPTRTSQHADNHIPQIALTLTQLAGGNLPEMSSAVMSWLNGVGEMATYIRCLYGMRQQVRLFIESLNKNRGKKILCGRWVKPHVVCTEVFQLPLCPLVLHQSGFWHTVPECSTVSSLVCITENNWPFCAESRALATTNRLLSHCPPQHLSLSPSLSLSLSVCLNKGQQPQGGPA